MKLQELYADGSLVVSFELFPPKTAKGLENLLEHVKELVSCGPSFITCTYGAGGATRERTLEVLDRVKRQHQEMPVAAHLTCVGSTVDELRDFVSRATRQGVSHIVALRGDRPRDKNDFTPAPGGLGYANELVTLIRTEFPALGILVAGYPDTHPEAPSPEADLDNLKRKVDAGADAIVTQLFYDNSVFFRFQDRCAAAGIAVPIVPGVLPITSLAQVQRIISLSGGTLPEALLQNLEACGGDPERQFTVGVNFAIQQVSDLIAGEVPGVHFYVLNKSLAAARICKGLSLSRA